MFCLESDFYFQTILVYVQLFSDYIISFCPISLHLCLYNILQVKTIQVQVNTIKYSL